MEWNRSCWGAALAGQTDAELAAGLHLTMPAVKARWRSIFARFEQREPAVAPTFFGQGAQGPQRRHRLLAWLRAHPEELRPLARESRPYALHNSFRDACARE